MNSQELEISLRTEFESYLKNALADSQNELSQLKQKIDEDLEKQKSHLHQLLGQTLDRIQQRQEFEPGFTATVVEHLRLARDEGARITATAFSATEDLARAADDSSAVKEISHAIIETSSKSTQAEILKALVHYAEKFSPRGAFFIVKNDRIVGWKVFGDGQTIAEEVVTNVFLPVRSRSILSEAISSLSTIKAKEMWPDDRAILQRLDFGEPAEMFAIPLVARGRGVAVLYADGIHEIGKVNVEALETLVRVAGLTVEVNASSKGTPKRETKKESSSLSSDSKGYSQSPGADTYTSDYSKHDSYSTPAPASYQTFEDTRMSSEEKSSRYEDASWSRPGDVAVKEAESEVSSSSDYQPSSFSKETTEEFSADASRDERDNFAFRPSEPERYVEPSVPEYSEPVRDEFTASDFRTEISPTPPAVEDFAPVVPPAEPAFDTFDYKRFQAETVAPVVEAPAPPPIPEVVIETPAPAPKRSRLSDRNVDLPIEVAEDERRLHNDARRFARLLVSEIKLYNEQKVAEGRESGDIYERLHEAIDRSREMYDKRIQPPVAAKFDYFHYEMVNTLAEGDDSRLGATYPGPTI